MGEDQEIGVAGGTEGGSVAVGVGVDDVAADGDMAGDRDAQSPAGRAQTDVAVRELFCFDGAADRFAESFVAGGTLLNDFIESAGFLPEAELTLLYPLRDVFAGAADEGQLEVVNDPGPVGSDVRDPASFQQID